MRLLSSSPNTFTNLVPSSSSIMTANPSVPYHQLQDRRPVDIKPSISNEPIKQPDSSKFSETASSDKKGKSSAALGMVEAGSQIADSFVSTASNVASTNLHGKMQQNYLDTLSGGKGNFQGMAGVAAKVANAESVADQKGANFTKGLKSVAGPVGNFIGSALEWANKSDHMGKAVNSVDFRDAYSSQGRVVSTQSFESTYDGKPIDTAGKVSLPTSQRPQAQAPTEPKEQPPSITWGNHPQLELPSNSSFIRNSPNFYDNAPSANATVEELDDAAPDLKEQASISNA